jgi:delta8-fatty-acid desaturase
MVFGPLAAILAVPTAIVPKNDLGALGSFFASALSMLLFSLTLSALHVCEGPAAVVLDRATNFRRNWEQDSLRSFVEATAWIISVLELHRASGHVLLTAALGAPLAVAMLCVADSLSSGLRAAERLVSGTTVVQAAKVESLALSEVAAAAGAVFFAVAKRVGPSPLEDTFAASVCMVALAELMRLWRPTTRAGEIVHDRLVRCAHNWSHRTVRSAVETSAWLALVLGSRHLCTRAALPDVAALLMGGVGGLAVCVLGETLLDAVDAGREAARARSVGARLAAGKHRGGRIFSVRADAELMARLRSPHLTTGSKSSGSASGSASTSRRARNAAREAAEPSSPVRAMIWREEEGKSVWARQFFDRPTRRSAARAARNGDLGPITMAEVARHRTRDDVWVCIEGRAYDLTSYVDAHPGGWLPMRALAGRDATDAFANYHPARVYEKLLPPLFVGRIADYRVSPFVREHREIRQELLRRGLFETRASFYVTLAAWLALLLGASVWLTLACEARGSSLAGALVLALFWQQLAFVGHDCGHSSIFHSMRRDAWLGLCLINTTGGIGLNWWKRSHNTHHVACNSIENDPDIQHLPAFAVTPEIFRNPGFWSTYHGKTMGLDLFGRTLVSWQHWIFYPFMFFARFNLYVQSWVLLLNRRAKVAWRGWSIASLLAFPAWYLPLAYASGDTWAQRLAWVIISHGFAGVLHVQICISHFSMDTYHGEAYNDEKDEWFRMQLKTTMNVDCSPAMDWFHGGLQFQIEHHLWPRLPRHNLREARKLCKALCAKHGIRYHEKGFFAANAELIDCMRTTALEARTTVRGDGGFFESTLWDGLNARG